MEQKIYDYCKEYGMAVIYAYYEAEDIDTIKWEKSFLVPMGDEPDDFYEEFGEDAEWDIRAEYDGMEEALKYLSGLNYSVNCDGYRIIATTEDIEEEIDIEYWWG